MGASASAGEKKKVIIVGAGYGGTATAKELDAEFNVTLISPNDALEHKWAYMRASVAPGWEEVTRVPLNKLLKNGKIVQGKVTEMTETSVKLSNGTTLEADYIVLAHGFGESNLPGGTPDNLTTSKQFKDTLIEKQKIIQSSKSILIVGGGPVGVELAGEIKAYYPNKKVTIVHSSSQLLNNSLPPMAPKFITQLNEKLTKMGVEVKLNTKVAELPRITNKDGFITGISSFTLSDGSVINDVDLCVVCTGGSPNKDFFVTSNYLDDSKHVIVDEYCKVTGTNTVYCIGDANNVKETKLGFYADLQAKLVASNLKALIKQKPTKKYVPGNGKTDYGTMFIPLGPKVGIAALGGTVLSDYFVSLIKGKGLFKNKVFQSVNATAPVVTYDPK